MARTFTGNGGAEFALGYSYLPQGWSAGANAGAAPQQSFDPRVTGSNQLGFQPTGPMGPGPQGFSFGPVGQQAMSGLQRAVGGRARVQGRGGRRARR